MKKIIIKICCLILGIIVIIGIILKIQSIDNNYYLLSEILNVDLDEIYIKGRSPIYDKQLNFLYGEHSASLKLNDGDTVQTKYVYYDSEGNEKFQILFLGNKNQVYVNDTKYIYSEDEISSTYTTHELYPDPSKNEAEKFAYNIIKLFEEDDEYFWEDYYTWYNQYPDSKLSNFINGIHFYNQGINIDILEYDDESIEDGYNEEVEYLGASISSSKDNIAYLNGTSTRYIVIKYNNLLIIVEEYIYQYATTYDENIENISIIENYLTEQNIL